MQHTHGASSVTHCEMKLTGNLVSGFPSSNFWIHYIVTVDTIWVHSLLGHRSLGKVSISLWWLMGFLIGPESSSKYSYFDHSGVSVRGDNFRNRPSSHSEESRQCYSEKNLPAPTRDRISLIVQKPHWPLILTHCPRISNYLIISAFTLTVVLLGVLWQLLSFSNNIWYFSRQVWYDIGLYTWLQPCWLNLPLLLTLAFFQISNSQNAYADVEPNNQLRSISPTFSNTFN